MANDFPDSRREHFLEKSLPSSEESERVICGAVLLDNSVMAQAVEHLTPEDFYSPLNRRIFGAMIELFKADKQIDPILIGEELKKEGSLDSIGGITVITNLTFGLPHFSNLEEYIVVVRDKARIRNLVRTCNATVGEALAEESNIEVMLDRAEQGLSDLRRVEQGRGFSSVHQLANKSVERVNKLRASGEVTTLGLRTGFIELDDMTSGFHKGELVVIAGRPSMGKSSLMVDLALNMCGYDPELVGAIFEMEMSEDSMGDKMVCQQSKVDATRYRKGHLLSSDIESLTYGLSELATKRIHIDTSPRLSALDIKARARRIKKKEGRLDFIIADHLGRMKGSGRKEKHLELGEITKELHAISKDLDTAVIALCQLSRSPETRPDKRPVMSDLRQCVVGSTRLIDASTGEWKKITEFQPGDSVLAVGKDQKIKPFTVKEVWPTGVKPVFNVRTTCRREIQCTDNHPLLTPTGWKRLDALKVGDVIATAMSLPDHGTERPENVGLCRLLGYMTGDGSYQKHRGISFISADEGVFLDVKGIVEKHFPKVTFRLKKSDYYVVDFTQLYANGYGKPYGNDFREWLRGLGVVGSRDNDKYVPDFVFQSGKFAAAAFLSGYLATDGCIKINRDQKIDICFDTTSLRLAQDVQALLLRIGVTSAISSGYKSKKATQNIYRVSPSVFRPNLQVLVKQLTIPGRKGVKLEQVKTILHGKNNKPFTNPGIFGLPCEVSGYVKKAFSPYKDQGKRMRREVCQEWGERLKDPGLTEWAESDLLWEKIVSIDPLEGVHPVFDICIPDAENFIGNGIVAHNSGEIEEDADVVMLLYRDEYYKETIDNAGKAELILAKNRNGSTGTIKLAFQKQWTHFANLHED